MLAKMCSKRGLKTLGMRFRTVMLRRGESMRGGGVVSECGWCVCHNFCYGIRGKATLGLQSCPRPPRCKVWRPLAWLMREAGRAWKGRGKADDQKGDGVTHARGRRSQVKARATHLWPLSGHTTRRLTSMQPPLRPQHRLRRKLQRSGALPTHKTGKQSIISPWTMYVEGEHARNTLQLCLTNTPFSNRRKSKSTWDYMKVCSPSMRRCAKRSLHTGRHDGRRA